MAEWIKKTLKLKENHGWSAKEGYNVFVADRGAVRFDIPREWIIVPDEKGSIKFHDKQPPDDDCVLQMTVHYLNDEKYDWSRLPVTKIVEDLASKETREVLDRRKIKTIRRDGMEVAWGGVRYMEKNENREAYSYTCLAKKSNILPLFTFDFWVDDAPRLVSVWDEILGTLVLADYIEDPTQRLLD